MPSKQWLNIARKKISVEKSVSVSKPMQIIILVTDMVSQISKNHFSNIQEQGEFHLRYFIGGK